MKILITTDWYRPVINGVVTSVLNLTEQLEKRGHEVKVLTLSRNCHSYKEENVIYAGSVGMGKIYPQARVKIPVVAREYMEELHCMEAGSDLPSVNSRHFFWQKELQEN